MQKMLSLIFYVPTFKLTVVVNRNRKSCELLFIYGYVFSGATTPAASVHGSDDEDDDEVDEEKELAELKISE